jgi:hypothetical protein
MVKVCEYCGRIVSRAKRDEPRRDRNKQILAAVRSGEHYSEIGKRFGLTGSTINQIALRAGIYRIGSPAKFRAMEERRARRSKSD